MHDMSQQGFAQTLTRLKAMEDVMSQQFEQNKLMHMRAAAVSLEFDKLAAADRRKIGHHAEVSRFGIAEIVVDGIEDGVAATTSVTSSVTSNTSPPAPVGKSVARRATSTKTGSMSRRGQDEGSVFFFFFEIR